DHEVLGCSRRGCVVRSALSRSRRNRALSHDPPCLRAYQPGTGRPPEARQPAPELRLQVSEGWSKWPERLGPRPLAPTASRSHHRLELGDGRTFLALGVTDSGHRIGGGLHTWTPRAAPTLRHRTESFAPSRVKSVINCSPGSSWLLFPRRLCCSSPVPRSDACTSHSTVSFRWSRRSRTGTSWKSRPSGTKASSGCHSSPEGHSRFGRSLRSEAAHCGWRRPPSQPPLTTCRLFAASSGGTSRHCSVKSPRRPRATGSTPTRSASAD